MAMRANPGKFDNALDEAVWSLSLDGGADEEVGSSSEAPGTWAGCLYDGAELAADIEADRGNFPNVSDADLTFLRDEASAGAILTENSDGFVKVKYYKSEADLDHDWEELEAELGGDVESEDDDDETEESGVAEGEFEEPSTSTAIVPASGSELSLGAPVTVEPAYRMGSIVGQGTRERDEWTGAKLYVVELPRSDGDVGLGNHPDDDVVVWIHRGRLKPNGRVEGFGVGDRVQLHPATDSWMRGDKYGEIMKVGREKLTVKLDRSGRTIRVSPRNIGEVVSRGGHTQNARRHRRNSSISDRRARGEIEGLTRAEIDSMEIRIPDWGDEWRQIGGDMNPGAHGGTVATANGQTIEIIEIQPVREMVGDDEAKDVGFPFWTKEGYYDADDLSLSNEGVQSAIEFAGLGEHLVKMTPEQRAVAIAEACVAAGHRTDEGDSGFSKDILSGRTILWASGERAGNEYLADEDDEFRRDVLGEEDDDDELEENRRHRRNPGRSELEIDGTLDQLLEMAAESEDGSGRGFVPREVKAKLRVTPELSRAVSEYEVALRWTLDEVVMRFPPNDGATSEELYDDNAPYLVLMTLRGEGVGIWDGDWDAHYDSEQVRKVGDLLKRKLSMYADETGGGKVEDALRDAVWEAAKEAGYEPTENGYERSFSENRRHTRPKGGSATPNSASVAWHVFLNGELVRTVYMPAGLTAGAVKRELLAEGYDDRIVVDQPPARRTNMPTHYRATTMTANRPWTRAYINDLPDSAFLYVDHEGERHFPYKNKNGEVDLPHLRNALARIPQSNVSKTAKLEATKHARILLASHGGYRR